MALEAIRLLGSTGNEITKDKNGENVPHLEIVEVVLVHCNIVNCSYQRGSRALFAVVPNKPSAQLLGISTTHFIFLKTYNSEFSYIKEWFTDQNSKIVNH